MDSFDYLIVGAGAAGAILAARLSEDAAVTVCLIEAGPADWHPWLHVPAGFVKVLFDPAFTWAYSSEPSEQTAGRRIPLPQGRALGGSTSINGLVYNLTFNHAGHAELFSLLSPHACGAARVYRRDS